MTKTAERRDLRNTLRLLVAGLSLAATLRCLGPGQGSHDGASPSSTQGAKAIDEKTLYHCPMHPTMLSDRPGDCPICGMRMVPAMTEEPGRGSPRSRPAAGAARKKALYRSTMNPDEVSERPGKDSMGMEMVPVEIEEAPSAAGRVEGQAAVRIPAQKQQLIGVRTTVVGRQPFVRAIRTVGRVTADETRLHHVHTKIEGWIDTLFVNATGERVRKGQPLLSLYSPELVATQGEYLLALKARRDVPEGASPEAARRAAEMLESGRRRLLRFDITPDQIEELERTGMPSRTMVVFSPITGFVTKRNVAQGEKIDPSTTLLDIADLSRVWTIASVYEYELPYVNAGQAASMTLSYLPGKIYQGKVTLIYPELEGATRTAQVRLEFSNTDLALKPEMYADVVIQSDLGARLAVPESAVLSTGTRDIVFVAQGEGFFEPRQVRLGLRLPDAVEVLEGLKEGDSVVTSGTFFIDSESKLEAALEAAAAPAPAKGP